MNAPGHAYLRSLSGEAVRVILESDNGDKLRCCIARFLKGDVGSGGYGTSDPAVMQAVVRAAFYLDELLLIGHSDSDGMSAAGFIGLVKEGSINSKMHADIRKGAAMLLGDGAVYTALNDAGLNTLAGIDSSIEVSGGINAAGYGGKIIINMIGLAFVTSGAFYGETQWTLYAYDPSASLGTPLESGMLAPGEHLPLHTWSGDLPASFAPGDRIVFVLDVVNGEGARAVQTNELELLPPVDSETVYRTDNRNDEWNTGVLTEVYIGSRDLSWLLAQTELWQTGVQNVEVSPSDLPDGGIVLDALMRPLTDGDYNLRGYVGFRYSLSLGRIQYVYQPNPQTSEGYWEVIVAASVEKWYGTGGWPESPSSAFPYRIRISAYFNAVAQPTVPPEAVTLSGFSVSGVDSEGWGTLALFVNRDLFTDTTLYLSGDPDARAVTDSYFYARQVSPDTPAYGVRAYADVLPSGINTVFPITQLN